MSPPLGRDLDLTQIGQTHLSLFAATLSSPPTLPFTTPSSNFPHVRFKILINRQQSALKLHLRLPFLDRHNTSTATMSNTQSEDKKAEASQQPQQQKPTVLEEDDEFEDFPVDDWPENETEQASGSTNGNNVHLWEESWDDDDAAEDFSKQLKEELKKVEASH